jgi:hypothetical protein
VAAAWTGERAATIGETAAGGLSLVAGRLHCRTADLPPVQDGPHRLTMLMRYCACSRVVLSFNVVFGILLGRVRRSVTIDPARLQHQQIVFVGSCHTRWTNASH